MTVSYSVASGKDIAQASKRQGRFPWTATNTIRWMEEEGEREALLIDVYDKEGNHGDYTTAWQTASYR